LPVLRLEHLALNVSDPFAMADWYVTHLGMRVVRRVDGPPHTRFLADAAGATVVEIYQNPSAPTRDYAAMDPLELHLAFVSADPDADRDALVAAGATGVSDGRLPDGSRLVMLRDPWGLALQLCARATPLVAGRD
jgi:catechol 2,3-dioxygenase-like lactoylglutathione lyase family enzyme